jgi:hypothetical protein
MQIMMGKMLAAAVSATARFAIADYLEHGPQTVADLAKASGTMEQPLYRVLRACASAGIFEELPDGLFANTPLSEPLRTKAVPCVRHIAMMFFAEWHQRGWTELPWSIETGKSAVYKAYDVAPFEYLAQHPADATLFNQAMMDLSTADSPLIASSYDYSQFKTLVDIGGGLGTLLGAILDRTPSLKGIVFDLPHVMDQIRQDHTLRKWLGRIDAVGGSFFDDVPPSDGYIMKHILHDWDDESSKKILMNCRKSIQPGGKVLVVDQVVPAGNVPSMSKLMDLEMLVLPGGRERTEKEWDALFTASGLKLEKIVTMPIPQSILVGAPV